MEKPAALTETAPPRVAPRAWLILFLSGLAAMLFYVDRQTLSVLKTSLKGELGWSDPDYGWLVASYMLPYTLCYLITGRLIDRWGTKIMMPVFILGMSLSTVASGIATSLWGFGISRFVLGAAEAGIIPAVMVAIVSWFPPESRGTASTVNKPLTVAGQILVVPLAAWLTAAYGWRSAFLVPGIFGIVCAVAWWLTDHTPTCNTNRTSGEPLPSYREVLGRPEIRGLLLARMVTDPLWFFLVFWQPGFLQEELGMSLAEFGRLGWIPSVAALIGVIALGIRSDALIQRGVSSVRSRAWMLVGASALAPAVLALTHTTSLPVALLWLSLVQMMATAWISLSNLLMSDLVPPRMVGTTVAVMSALGATTATVFNWSAGPLIAKFGYGNIFLLVALLNPLAAFILWRAYLRAPAIVPLADQASTHRSH